MGGSRGKRGCETIAFGRGGAPYPNGRGTGVTLRGKPTPVTPPKGPSPR